MWSNVRNLFGRRSSRETAKGRLHLVLAHDRAGLDGARLQEMRAEIAAVLARYVDIDPEAIEIEVERVEREGTQLRVSGPLRAR
jgi:cell division topological specificity factor